MKLWNKEGNIDKIIEKYTIGNDPEFDQRLAKYDVMGSLAHAKMLYQIDYLTGEEYQQLKKGLAAILKKVEDGSFEIEPGVEDVHSQVEFMLINQFGEVGKKLHVGRSRNDQIAVDLKLYYRHALQTIKDKLKALSLVFLDKAEQTKHILMPGYTHSQAGMVSSFGLWYGSFAESIADDYRLCAHILEQVDQNPLGSAAGYGSSLPNDRDFTTKELSFSGLCVNSMYAQMTRGKAELLIGQLFSTIALTINRFASDICIFSNENYRFLKLPDTYTTGSSIMPHKKNPDVLELTRAKCNQLATTASRIQILLSNMQSGYHRDYQLLKEILFPEIDRMQDVLDVVIYCIPIIEEKEDIMNDEKYKLCYTVENINARVKAGEAFRDAYHSVKKEVNKNSFVPLKKVEHSHLGSLGNLGIGRIKQKLSWK